MSTMIALSKAEKPKEQSQSKIVSSRGSNDSASLDIYEPKAAPGGSKPGNPLGNIKFQFNPKEITISKSAKWERTPTKGAKKAGPPQFSGSDPCKLTMEIFFDATLNSDQSVVESVEKLFSCCVPLEKSLKENKPMPPLVVFKWGGITSFPAYVSQVNVKYTRFAANGVPIRAVCTVNLEEMSAEDLKQNPTSGVLAVERVHTMIAGDNLAGVSYQEYGDPALWRPLAEYNGVDDPMRIPNGTQILLPAAEALLA
jgi:contractile injection system tube protein